MDEEAERLVVQMAKENPAGATIAFEAQGEETERCQRFAEFEAERICHRVHGSRNTESRNGWGNFVGLSRVIIVWGNYGNFWTGFDFCAANDAEEFGVYGGGGALPDVGNWGHYGDFYGRECGFVAATSLLASRAVGAGVYRVSYVS